MNNRQPRCRSKAELLVKDVDFFGEYTKLININKSLANAQADCNVDLIASILREVTRLSISMQNKIHNINSQLLDEVCDGRGKDTIPVA